MAQQDTLSSKNRVDLIAHIQSSIDSSEYSNFEFIENFDAYEIQYESGGHNVRGYLFEPKTKGPHPLIIFNRGGNRDFASLNLDMLVSYTGRLAANGYVVLASNYRSADEFGGRDVNDVLTLIDISNSIAKVDTSNIGMLGWSRGGMMAYLCMSKTDRLKTVVVGNGPTDLEATLKERPGLEEKVFSQCIPNYELNKPLELWNRSVINWPEKLNKNTSLLILAGTEDQRVNFQQSESLAEALDELELEYVLKNFPTDHFFSDMKEELHDELLTWFNEKLKKSY